MSLSPLPSADLLSPSSASSLLLPQSNLLSFSSFLSKLSADALPTALLLSASLPLPGSSLSVRQLMNSVKLEATTSDGTDTLGLSHRMVFKLSLAASKLIDYLCNNLCSMVAIIKLLRGLPHFLACAALFADYTSDPCWRAQLLESLVSLRNDLDNFVRRVNVCPFDGITLYLVALFTERHSPAFERDCDAVYLRHGPGDFDYTRVRKEFQTIHLESMESWMQMLVAGQVDERSYLHPKQWYTQVPGLEEAALKSLRQGLLPALPGNNSNNNSTTATIATTATTATTISDVL